MSTGEPFARLAASARPSRTRVAIAVVLLVPCTAVVTVVAVGAADLLLGIGSLTDPGFLLVATLVVPSAWLGIAALTARYVLRIRPARALSVTGRFRWRWYASCLAVAVPVGGSLAAVQVLSVGGPLAPTARWPLVAAIVVLGVPLQAFAEEYLFRGVLALAVGARLARRGAVVAVPLVTSVLFAAVHPHPDPMLLGLVVVGAVVYAVLTHLTGGLEAASAAHAVWNLGPLLAVGALGLQPSVVTGGGVVLAALGEIGLGTLLVLIARRSAERTSDRAPAVP